MLQKKYVSLTRLSNFLDNLNTKFASMVHKHSISDITDYTVDTELSSTSTNPVQNKIVDAEFEAIATAMNILEETLDNKSDSTHNHDSSYQSKLIGAQGQVVGFNADGVATAQNVTVVGTVTYDITERKYVCDKTYEELYNAYSMGKIIELRDNAYIYSCIGCEDYVLSFANLFDKTSLVYRISHNSDTNTDVIEETYNMFINAEGDEMYGALTLAGDPTENLHASTKQYVDSNVSDLQTNINTNLDTAKNYTDTKIANLINGAPTTLDTLGEIATAMEENQDVVLALDEAIGGKANASDLTSHVNNKENPHGVTLEQLGVTATSTELNVLDGITATTTELNYTDGVTSNIQTQINSLNSNFTNLNIKIEKIQSHIGQIIHSTTLDTMQKVIDIYGGTTWIKIEGRFLLGQSSAYTINSTGGEATHTLTTKEIPSHAHEVAVDGNINYKMSVGDYYGGQSKTYNINQTEVSALYGGKFLVKTITAGEGFAHNNMPPYKAVYIWERTA